jgi:hypothetical protein
MVGSRYSERVLLDFFSLLLLRELFERLLNLLSLWWTFTRFVGFCALSLDDSSEFDEEELELEEEEGVKDKETSCSQYLSPIV